ncbi:hypothetical protein DYI96_02815 [Acinetobacter sp. SWAC57]|nr:hypothetical protein DYI96_02815 [Acinetobacter sp. SWAC57]
MSVFLLMLLYLTMQSELNGRAKVLMKFCIIQSIVCFVIAFIIVLGQTATGLDFMCDFGV